MPKPVIPTADDDGSQGSIDAPERLRKVPGKVTDDGLEHIENAIALKRATSYHLTPSMSDGEALVRICRDWLVTESARLSRKGGDGG